MRLPWGNCPTAGSRQKLCEPKISQLMNSSATELSSSVVMISFVRSHARAIAGTATNSVPPSAPATSIATMLAGPGSSSPSQSATPEASTEPM